MSAVHFVSLFNVAPADLDEFSGGFSWCQEEYEATCKSLYQALEIRRRVSMGFPGLVGVRFSRFYLVCKLTSMFEGPSKTRPKTGSSKGSIGTNIGYTQGN